MNERIKKLQNDILEQGLDGFLVGSEANRMYLSGFTGSNGMLLVTKDEQYIVTDFRYLEQVSKQCPDFTCVDQKQRGLVGTTLDIARKLGLKKLGFEGEHTSFVEYEELTKASDLTFISCVGVIEQFRKVKSTDEIDKIARAEAIGDLAFEGIVKYIKENWKKGITEREVALEIECIMRRNGASGISFDTIVASGAKSSLPHAVPGDDLLKEGDFVVMDFGCIYEGYCSDMTRTVVIGHASKKHEEIYNIVLEAQLAAIKGIKPGMKGKEVDAIARDLIKEKGYGEYFGHGLGHSLGIEIHENPRFSVGEEEEIKEGMVITVEPGIYLPGFGGVRIEDVIVVTKDGVKNLTNSPKQLIVID